MFLASCRVQSGFFTFDDIFGPPSLSSVRKVLEFGPLSFYVPAPYRSQSVLPRDPCSCIGVVTSNPHRTLLRGSSSTFAGWQKAQLYAFHDVATTLFDIGKATPETHGTMAFDVQGLRIQHQRDVVLQRRMGKYRGALVHPRHATLARTYHGYRTGLHEDHPRPSSLIHLITLPMSSNIAHLLTSPQDKAIPPRHRSRCIDLPHRTVVVRASGSFPEQQLPLAASVSLKTRRRFRRIPFAVGYCSFTRGLLWAYWETCWRSPKASANAMKFSGRRGGPF